MDEATKQIVQAGIDNLDGLKGMTNTEVCDLHHLLYNEDYFIIGTYRAKEFLNLYGVFEAIEKVKEYEQDNFGETTTDFSDPEKVANMLAYVVGEEALAECQSYQKYYDRMLTDKIIDKIKRELEAQL